jgi:hypothetical protein
MAGKIRRPSAATVIACLALAVALGGTSYAAVSLPKNSVGTRQLKKNAVTSVKVKNHSLRSVDFARGQVPAGPQGPAGPAGPAGPGAKWALLKADGTILAQSGGISLTSHVAPGTYILDFGSSVTDKLMLGTASFANAGFRGTVIVGPCGGPPQGAVACPVGGDNNHVVVFASNAANTAGADNSVFVAVIG